MLLISFLLIVIALMLAVLNAVTGRPHLWLPVMLLCIAEMLRGVLLAGLKGLIV